MLKNSLSDFINGRIPPKNDRPLRRKANKFVIASLFLGTIGLSALLYSKDKFKGKITAWVNKFNTSATYQIVKPPEKTLAETIGFQPNLKDKEGIKSSINLLTKDLSGTYGVYWQQLQTGDSFGLAEDQVFTAASVNKLPIMVNFYQQVEQGKLKEDDQYVLSLKDIQDFGSGQMRYQPIGTTYQYSDLITFMGKNSDNTAAYVVDNLVGQQLIQDRLNKLGMINTSIQDNTTTPKEMGNYLTKLYLNKLVKEKYRNIILNTLTDTDFEDRISLGVPQGIKIAHKIGNEVQVYNDCGIIFGFKPYVLCVLTKEVAEDEALDVIPKISRLVWEYTNK